jgi:hypothetical protein
MGFLLEDTSQGQRFKDGPALDLHFSGQVVDSDLRLVHPSSRYLTGLKQFGIKPGEYSVIYFVQRKPAFDAGPTELTRAKCSRVPASVRPNYARIV